MKTKILLALAAAMVLVCSCDKDGTEPNSPAPTPTPQPAKIPIKLSTTISKVTDSGYESGDMIGIYTVNYVDGKAGTLANSGNHLDNIKFTFDGSNWTPEKQVYWLDQTTKADFYCYYPYTGSVANVSGLAFSVKEDQSTTANYKASELIWGKTSGAAPSANPVNILTNHALSNIIIYVTPGNGYTEETLAAEEISVTITGVKTSGKLDLVSGKVVADGDAKNIKPLKENGYWRALIIPQDIIGTKIIEVKVGASTYSLSNTVKFEQNKQHKCTLKIDKIGEGVNISIGGWENDGSDFGGTLD